MSFFAITTRLWFIDILQKKTPFQPGGDDSTPTPPLFHLACSEVNSTKDPKLLEWPWATEAQDSREAKYLAHPLEKENHQIKRYLFWNRDMYGYVSSQQGYQSTSICLESIFTYPSLYISIFIKVYQFNSIYTSWHKLEGKSWRYAILKVTQHLPSRTKISHLWKGKIIFKIALVGDMLVPRRAHIVSICTLYQYMYPPAGKWIPAWWRSSILTICHPQGSPCLLSLPRLSIEFKRHPRLYWMRS